MAANSACLLGLTGSGKSSLGNYLAGYRCFTVGKGTRSETAVCTSRSVNLSGDQCDIIDTPGMDDSEGRDEEFCSRIVQVLRDRRTIGAILLVVKGREKLSRSVQQKLNIFERMFCHERNRETVCNNIGLVFTHWDWSKRAERSAMETGKLPAEAFGEEFNRNLKKVVPLLARNDGGDFPCFFVDATFDTIKDLADKNERLRQSIELEKLKKFILERSIAPVNCLSLQDVIKAENEAKREAKREAEREASIAQQTEMGYLTRKVADLSEKLDSLSFETPNPQSSWTRYKSRHPGNDTILVSGETRQVHEGPRGGRYYYTRGGNKQYVRRKG